MLSKDEIQKIASKILAEHFPPDCTFIHCERRENPYGYYFVANAYDPASGMLYYIGGGGFFVDGESGEVICFGSADIVYYGLDYWLDLHRRGLRRVPYAIVVQSVSNLSRLLDVLASLKLTYTVFEIESGIVWPTAKSYTRELLAWRLENLPCQFGPFPVSEIEDIASRILREKCCDFTYEPYKSEDKNRPKYASDACLEDLIPRW